LFQRTEKSTTNFSQDSTSPDRDFNSKPLEYKAGANHRPLLTVTVQVLTATSMKVTVFGSVAHYSVAENERYFRGFCWPMTHRSDDGDSKYLWNVGQYLRDYKVQYSITQPPSLFAIFGSTLVVTTLLKLVKEMNNLVF
jgi:hypothetical protein